MADLAKKIAACADINAIIGLKGSLGVGKSFFARKFINSLSEKELNVPSPTFNLVYPYKTNKAEIFHFDLYRLKEKSELENIGFFDAIKSGISLIEWPEIIEDFLQKKQNYIEIKISSKSNGSDIRKVEITAKF